MVQLLANTRVIAGLSVTKLLQYYFLVNFTKYGLASWVLSLCQKLQKFQLEVSLTGIFGTTLTDSPIDGMKICCSILTNWFIAITSLQKISLMS